ncbi:MAG: aminopeptidase [Caulobacteraceae bacterium]
MNRVLLERYARLVVKAGVNIQEGQILVIRSPLEGAEFVRMAAKIAYEECAKEVVVRWEDEQLSRMKFLYAAEEVFDRYPEWQKEFFLSYQNQGAAFLTILASDPELLKGVNPDRITRQTKVAKTALKEYRERQMRNESVWCLISIPSPVWAKKVFPGFSETEAVEKLWDAIFKAVRADEEDPIAAWDVHKDNLKKSMDFMNSNSFKFLQYKNSLGTDLKVELPENHVWLGGSDYTPEGFEFIANIPTEEVFTLPKKTGVNGTAASTKPLSYNGNLIENFTITFKDGRITDFKAEKGQDTLKELIETDEGSHYLGEVALVPYDSPISKSGILFSNTLFDENASCHLAIGKAYPVNIKDSEKMSKEELEKLGVNDSFVHEDFMIGSRDLEITGITADGREVPVFRNGNFV